MTPMTVDAVRSPSGCGNKVMSIVKNYAGVIKNNSEIVNARDFFWDSRVDEQNLDFGIAMQGQHAEEVANKNVNLTARKLNFEEKTSEKSDDGNPQSLCSLFGDNSVAGLSYIYSQEPGEQLQADALNTIDNFLFINDVGLSQEPNDGKSVEVRTSPVSSAAGAHNLLKMSGPRSPVGKSGIFDWVDSLEDEGGGDFFRKRKDLFFGSSEHLKNSNTQFLKKSRLARGAFDKLGDIEGRFPNADSKRMRLTFSEPRPKQDIFITYNSLDSPVKTSRALLAQIAGKLKTESPTMNQSNERCAERREENTYDIGPDTQVAAEAMEALVLGHFSEHVDRAGNAADPVMSPVYTPVKKRRTSSNLGGSVRRSMRIKMLHADANSHGNSSKENESLKRGLRKSARMKHENELSERKPRKSLRTETAQSKGKFSSPLGTEVDEAVAKSGTERVGESAGSLSFNDQTWSDNECVQRVNSLSVTPVAHRTRSSKLNAAVRHRKQPIDYEMPEKGLMVENPAAPKRKRSRIIVSQPETGEASNEIKEHVENISGEFNVQGSTVLPEEPCTANALLEKTPVDKTLRTTHENIPGSGYTDKLANFEGPPLSRHGSTVASENADIIPKLVENQSKDPACLLSTGKNHGTVKGVSPSSNARSRSFSQSHLGTSEGESVQSLKGDILIECGSAHATCSASIVNEKAQLEEVKAETSVSIGCANSKQGAPALSDAQDALEKGGQERVQLLDSTSTVPTSKLSALSPVCTSVDSLRATCKRRSSKSLVARELIRLQDAPASPDIDLKDVRRRRDIASIRVCLSHHLDDDIIKQQKKILARLGASTVGCVSEATHFVADKFVRTRNMLEAIALGKPVVSHQWLESCGQSCCFIDERNYILRDVKKEKEICFNMPDSLSRARQTPLLQGKRVFITPNVKPGRELVADLVRAAQGQVYHRYYLFFFLSLAPLERIGRSSIRDGKVPNDLLVISCEEDLAICTPFLETGAEVFSSELLLNGIVVQRLEHERHRIFADRIKRTRSTIWFRASSSSRFLPVGKCSMKNTFFTRIYYI
ncbi:unnamed protein product [Spirodela intermedia]|uniref:BRCT domain-containing protein n=1 Tax=Spirodela intermedia TaxID=51605 RepID=A0A7I8KQ88_SPIIN|nr:unnamed protein product [Spirodela intermedia]